jgi:hypothetical protein
MFESMELSITAESSALIEQAYCESLSAPRPRAVVYPSSASQSSAATARYLLND